MLDDAFRTRLYPIDTPIRDLPIGGYRPDLESRPRPAAVLVPVTDERDPRILLTVRAAHLAKHAGQVAFPGGGRDRPGETVVQTALREAEEETESSGEALVLEEIDGMTAELAANLRENNIKDSEDVAELSIDELTEYEGVDEELAGRLIMAARAPWFA